MNITEQEKEDRNLGWLASVLLAISLLLFFQSAHAFGSCPTNGGCTQQDQPRSKNTVSIPVVVTGIITLGATGRCVYKRFWTDNPCYDFNQWRKTSAADDRVTPDL